MEIKHRSMTLDNFNPITDLERRALEQVRLYAQDPQTNNVLFFGPVGCGKTHLACGLLRALIAQHRCDVKFETVSGLLRRIRQTYGGYYDDRGYKITEAGIIEGLISEDVQYFALDDIGFATDSPDDSSDDDSKSEKETQWVRGTLYHIIDTRLNRGLATIATTNLDPATVARSHGDRIISRLMFDSVLIRLDGQDHRKPKIEVL